MKWEKFDHQKLYDDGEYVVEIGGRLREVLTNQTDHDQYGDWYNYWASDWSDDYNQDFFTRIFRLDLADTPSPVEQANTFLDARFDTIN